jgi:F1F0 ATPase subunit 2
MNTVWIIVALAIGAVLGAFYFGGLWMTVRRVGTPQPASLLFVSFLVRMGVVLLGFYFVMDGRWERLVACMVGFVLARSVLIHFLHDTKFPVPTR